MKLLPLLSPQLDVVGITGDLKPFNAPVLATLLRSFHPPIQFLTLGGAFDDQEAASASKVWEEYRRDVESKKEEFGEESAAATGFVRTTSADITRIKKEQGIEGYEAVGKALLRNLDKVRSE